MSREDILKHDGWKYISSLNPTQRHLAIFGNQRSNIEKMYDCKIEEWPYARLSDVTEDMVSLSVTDGFRNISMIAVLIPNPHPSTTK